VAGKERSAPSADLSEHKPGKWTPRADESSVQTNAAVYFSGLYALSGRALRDQAVDIKHAVGPESQCGHPQRAEAAC